jgi:hypothetical protein
MKLKTMNSQPNTPSQPQNVVSMPAPKPTRRIRGDAFWSRLQPEHRKQLHTWLFEERLTFRDAHQRARKELGLDCSLATIGRCYQYILREQAADEVADALDSAQTILQSGGNVGKLRAAAMELIATRLLQKAMDHADPKDLNALGRLVLEAEEKELRRERGRLLREKFEFKASKAALKLLPMAAKMREDELEAEDKRIKDIQWKLFGKQLLGIVGDNGHEGKWDNYLTQANSACLTSAQINSTKVTEKIPSPATNENPDSNPSGPEILTEDQCATANHQPPNTEKTSAEGQIVEEPTQAAVMENICEEKANEEPKSVNPFPDFADKPNFAPPEVKAW